MSRTLYLVSGVMSILSSFRPKLPQYFFEYSPNDLIGVTIEQKTKITKIIHTCMNWLNQEISRGSSGSMIKALGH